MTTLVGYVTALLTRDPSHEAAPVVVEIYVPAESPGQRTRRFNLGSLCEPRELAMVSVLRDALVHHLAVNLSYHGSDELDAVELHLPVRETYSEGQAQGAAGRIRWLSVNESVMSNTQRGQPDTVTVQLEHEPPFILIIERRNEDTKLAQLELLRDAFLNERPVHLSVVPYRVAPGRDVPVIVGVGLGEPPPAWTPEPLPMP
jgi:hypothetical protein